MWRGKDPRRLKGGRFALGEVVDPKTGEAIDQAILLVFRAPRSYTGEDLVEFQTHGSPAVLRRVMEVLVAEGARPAGRGEFTFRAYLNGKMDLAQAEAVLALIEAEGELARRQALRALEGALSRRIEALENRLLNLLAHIQALLDYPEEGWSPWRRKGPSGRSSPRWRPSSPRPRPPAWPRRGPGSPSSGPPTPGRAASSTPFWGTSGPSSPPSPEPPGTTSEAPLELFGIPLVAVDTAGVRETEDPVERMGVERALGIAEEADLVLYVVDRSQPKPAPPPCLGRGR